MGERKTNGAGGWFDPDLGGDVCVFIGCENESIRESIDVVSYVFLCLLAKVLT